MTGWYQSNADRRKKSEPQASASQKEGLSATGGKLGFQLPGYPVEIIVPDVKPKPKGPATYVPGSVKMREAFKKRLAQEGRERRIERLKKKKAAAATGLLKATVKKHPFIQGFKLGWEIGQYWFHPGQVSQGGWENADYEHIICSDGPNPTFYEQNHWNVNHSANTWGFGSGTSVCGTATVTLHTGYASMADLAIAEFPLLVARGFKQGLHKPSHSWAAYHTIDFNHPKPWYDLNPGDYIPGTGTPAQPVVDAPMDNPEAWPVGQPVRVVPQKWADALPKEGEQPSNQPRRGTGTAARPSGGLASPPMVPFPVVVVVPGPGVEFKPPTIIISPGDAGVGSPNPVKVRWRDNDAKKKRPHKRDKEKKINVASVGGKVWVMLNVATEAQDFLEAANKALPKECQAKPKGGKSGNIGKPRPNDILAALYKCWDHFDAKVFIAEFVSNQIEDAAYGSLGKAGTKATQAMNINTGLQSALKEGQKKAQKLGGEDAEELELPIPVMKYDPETDVWTLTAPGLDPIEY